MTSWATWIGIAVIAWIAVGIGISFLVGGGIKLAESRRVVRTDARVRQLRPRPRPAPAPLRRAS